MSYKVLSEFNEGGHLYKVGASYPHETAELDTERAEYLADVSRNGATAFLEKAEDDGKDERYDSIKAEELKALLSKAEIQFPEKAKKPELFALAVENELI